MRIQKPFLSRNPILICVCAVLLGAFALLPWWRNHAQLLDFFDYGLVMAATGRIQLGERPYVDFITPIQTLQFIQSALAEQVWGARYLSLTYANAIFILGSFVGLAILLGRRLGAGLGLVISAAVVIATSAQHTIVWYNAMGVTWLAIIVWLTAEPTPIGRSQAWRFGLVWAALWLGGMTKLTFQIAALAFACTFAIRSAYIQVTSWRTARLTLLSYLLFGVVAPIATELLVTGATLAQWLDNVVAMPAQFRTHMLGQIATIRFYFHTPHDYYPPLYFAYTGAWGVALLAVAGAVTGYGIRAMPEHRRTKFAFLGVLLAGTWICGSVLLATNMDIAHLSGAAWLVMVTGLALAFPLNGGNRGQRGMQIILGLAATSLLIPAWLSAWDGARALWGHEPRVRTNLVSTDDLPKDFNYIRGLKILPSLHASLQEFQKTRAIFSTAGIPPGTFYFANGTEWMVRVMPEARHRDLPLWIALGTTLSDVDAWKIGARINEDPRFKVIVSYEGWDYWSAGLQKTLHERYHDNRVGPRMHLYTRRELPEPVEFAVDTHSNLYARRMKVTGGPVELKVASNALFYFGGDNSHRIDLEFGLFRLSGEMVGELRDPKAGQHATALFRIYARDGARLTDKLWEERVELTPESAAMSRPFSISSGGRPVSLILQLPPETPASFGWRKLHTEHAGGREPTAPWPMDPKLKRQSIELEEIRALIAGGSEGIEEVQAFGVQVRSAAGAAGTKLISGAPGEFWIRMSPGVIHASGEFGLREETWTRPEALTGLRVNVIAYRSGRFDLMWSRELHPKEIETDRQPQRFDAWLPEGVGWIGLVVTPLDATETSEEVASWKNVHVW